MTTTTTERDAALARLREVVKPGDVLYVVRRGTTRSGQRLLSVFSKEMVYDLTADVARVTGRQVQLGDNGAIRAKHPYEKAVMLALSVALFGNTEEHVTWRSL